MIVSLPQARKKGLKDLNPHVAKGRPIDLADVKRLCLNGFMASVLPMNKKLEYLEGVNNYFLTTPGLLYKKFVPSTKISKFLGTKFKSFVSHLY